MIGKRRISPSKSSWLTGSKPQTKYEKSCPRFVVWERRFEKEVDIDPIYEAMGTIDETLYATKLKRNGIPFQREVEISHPIGATGVTIEGRIDFIETQPNGTVLTEKKSTISPRRLNEIIIKGQVDQHHLAQLVSYMAVRKEQHGQIVVTFWKWSDDLNALMVGGERTFKIRVAPAGEIYVDDQPYAAHVRHLQRWYHHVAEAMNKSETELPERPYINGWINPCKNCPLANSCNKYDIDRNVQSFWMDTKNIEMSAGPAAQIVEPKLEKRKKNEHEIPDRSNPDHDTGRISDKTGIRWGEMD